MIYGSHPPKISEIILLAMGSNQTSPAGCPPQTLNKALAILQNRGAVIRAVSTYYQTPAFPARSGPDFVNAAAALSAQWTPKEALAHFHAVEAEMGRERTTRWGQRTLDIDLLAVGQTVLPDAQTHAAWRDLPLSEQASRAPDTLILPHPRMQDRAFVLVPLADVAPDWRHPVLGRTVREMLDALPRADKTQVRALQ